MNTNPLKLKYLDIINKQLNVFEPILNPLYSCNLRELKPAEEDTIKDNLLAIAIKGNKELITQDDIDNELIELENLRGKFPASMFLDNILILFK